MAKSIYYNRTNHNHSPHSSHQQAPTPEQVQAIARAIGGVASPAIIASTIETLTDIDAILDEVNLSEEPELDL